MSRHINGTVNTVFQKYALFPHLNVFENIAFGLRIAQGPGGKKIKEEEIRARHWKCSRLYH